MKEQLQLSSALLIFFLFLHTHTHTPHHTHPSHTLSHRNDCSLWWSISMEEIWCFRFKELASLTKTEHAFTRPRLSSLSSSFTAEESSTGEQELLEFTEFYWQLTAAELCTSRQESTPVCGGLLGSLPTLTCWTREDPRWLLCLIGNQQGLTGGENFVATWHTYLFISANSVVKHGHIVHIHREQEVVSHWCVATALTLQNICLFFGVMCSIH